MSKTTKMKRKIPKITVNVPFEYFITIPEVKEVVIEEVVVAIKEGIEKKKKSISLFEIANSNYYIDIEKQQWKASLQNALDYYIEKEQYDKCIECRDLISKL